MLGENILEVLGKLAVHFKLTSVHAHLLMYII